MRYGKDYLCKADNGGADKKAEESGTRATHRGVKKFWGMVSLSVQPYIGSYKTLQEFQKENLVQPHRGDFEVSPLRPKTASLLK